MTSPDDVTGVTSTHNVTGVTSPDDVTGVTSTHDGTGATSFPHLVAALLARPHVEHEDRVEGSARQQVQVADVVEEARHGGLQADQVGRQAAVVGLLVQGNAEGQRVV